MTTMTMPTTTTPTTEPAPTPPCVVCGLAADPQMDFTCERCGASLHGLCWETGVLTAVERERFLAMTERELDTVPMRCRRCAA